jgi:hypothetical protein
MKVVTSLFVAALTLASASVALAQSDGDSTDELTGTVGYTAPVDPQGGNQITANRWCRGSVDAEYIVCDQAQPLMTAPSGDNMGNHVASQDLQLSGHRLVSSSGPVKVAGGLNAEGNSTVGGNLQVTGNVTAPSGGLQVAQNAVVGGQVQASLLRSTGALNVTGNGQINGQLVVGNIVNANAYFHTSDRTLKDQIERIEDPFALLEGIEGTHFVWKEDGQGAFGVIAQDVALVMPDAVHTRDNGKLAVDYDQLIAPLVEAVKHLKADNDNLRAEIEALKAAQ